MFIKARVHKDRLDDDVDTHVWEGMTVAELWTTLEQYLTGILGDTDHTPIIEKALKFGDFNNDATVILVLNFSNSTLVLLNVYSRDQNFL